jgi:hypothetical protein
MGERFGYVSEDGRFSINEAKKNYVSLSDYLWAQYGARDNAIDVKDTQGKTIFSIADGHGYPFFLDERTFLIHQDQASISQLDDNGNIVWTYDFVSPVVCVDAADGFLLAGTLDGTIELIDKDGKRFYAFEPSGSRISAIFGCAISDDGQKIAAISGIDKQRFIFIEQYGAERQITFHEFLEEGFRTPVHISFVDNDRKIAFEREGALGLYDIKSRISYKIPLDGKIIALDESGEENFLFLITAQNDNKKNLVMVEFPDTLLESAPFVSENVFLARHGSRLFVGGGRKLASFAIERK